MIVRPCRLRAQNAFTRRESHANSTSTSTATTVMRKIVKCGLPAKNCRSKAGIFEKSGGFGKTPCVNAYSSTARPAKRSNGASHRNAEATVAYEEFLIDVLTRKTLITSPPCTGTTLLKPTAAR